MPACCCGLARLNMSLTICPSSGVWSERSASAMPWPITWGGACWAISSKCADTSELACPDGTFRYFCSRLPRSNAMVAPFEGASRAAIAHQQPVEDQQDDRADECADETGGLLAAIDTERLAAVRRNERTDDPDRRRDEKTARVLARHDELREQPYDDTDQDGPDDAHALLHCLPRFNETACGSHRRPSDGGGCLPLWPVPRRELLFQRFELRQVVIDDIRLVRMKRKVILVIILGRIELVERCNFGDDRLAEQLCRIELRNVAFGEFLLFRSGVEDRRTILRTDVGTLPVQLRRVVCNGKENLEEIGIRDLRRIVGDLHSLGVTRRTGADHHVVRRGAIAPRVTRYDLLHAFHVFVNGVDAPEAATGKHGGGFAARRRLRRGAVEIGNRRACRRRECECE